MVLYEVGPHMRTGGFKTAPGKQKFSAKNESIRAAWANNTRPCEPLALVDAEMRQAAYLAFSLHALAGLASRSRCDKIVQ